MVYLPTFNHKFQPNAGKHTIHGASGYWTCQRHPWKKGRACSLRPGSHHVQHLAWSENKQRDRHVAQMCSDIKAVKLTIVTHGGLCVKPNFTIFRLISSGAMKRRVMGNPRWLSRLLMYDSREVFSCWYCELFTNIEMFKVHVPESWTSIYFYIQYIITIH